MINNEILAIKDKIVQTVNPRYVYLFGSYAKDTYNDNSDYDFYVVVSDDAGDQIDLSQMLYKSLRGIRKRPVDIVVGYESTFLKRVNEITLERTVFDEGVILYGKSMYN